MANGFTKATDPAQPWGMQIKTTMRLWYIISECPKVKVMAAENASGNRDRRHSWRSIDWNSSLRNSLIISSWTKHSYHANQPLQMWAFSAEKWKLMLTEKCVHKYFTSFICNSPKLETIRCSSVSEWLNKLAYPYSGILPSSEKEQSINTCNNLDKSLKICVKWRHPIPKYLICWFQLYYQNDKIMEMGNRWVVIRLRQE
jgi:hypothetical protein